MPWKITIFHIQNAIKTTFMNEITWNLVHTFIRDSSSDVSRFLKIWKLKAIFCKNKKKCWKILKNFPNFPNFKNPRSQCCSTFFSAYATLFRLSLSLTINFPANSVRCFFNGRCYRNLTSSGPVLCVPGAAGNISAASNCFKPLENDVTKHGDVTIFRIWKVSWIVRVLLGDCLQCWGAGPKGNALLCDSCLCAKIKWNNNKYPQPSTSVYGKTNDYVRCTSWS